MQSDDLGRLASITKQDYLKYDIVARTASKTASSNSAVPPPEPPPPQPAHEANADTGSNGHYMALKDMNCLHDVREVAPHEAITVTLPAGEEIHSTHTGELRFSPAHAGQRVHVFRSLWGSLLGIGDLCDVGLVAVFDKHKVYIVDPESDAVVLTGNRDTHTRLWMIALTPITPVEEKNAVCAAQKKAIALAAHAKQVPQHAKTVDCAGGITRPEEKTEGKANNVSEQKSDTVGDRVEFFGRIFCSAAETTLMEAVKKRWIKFPGITSKVLKRHRHRLRTHESAAGHLDQVHQNHQPSRSHLVEPTTEETATTPINIITHIHQERNHMDATGRFPAMSHEGHQYVLIMYSEAGNYIKALPMADRSKQSYLKAHRTALMHYEKRGYVPTFQRLPGQ
jgi:hypothetical protein